MSSNGKRIAIAITCSDWRLHQDVVHYNGQLAKLLQVDGVDLIALPGPDGFHKADNAAWLRTASEAATLLANAHSAVCIAVVDHYRCAGNPVDDAMHDADVVATAKTLRSRLKFGGPIVAVSTIYHDDTDWSLKEVERV